MDPCSGSFLDTDYKQVLLLCYLVCSRWKSDKWKYTTNVLYAHLKKEKEKKNIWFVGVCRWRERVSNNAAHTAESLTAVRHYSKLLIVMRQLRTICERKTNFRYLVKHFQTFLWLFKIFNFSRRWSAMMGSLLQTFFVVFSSTMKIMALKFKIHRYKIHKAACPWYEICTIRCITAKRRYMSWRKRS